MDFPTKKYSIIYADPPWAYRSQGTGKKSRGTARKHYDTMTTEELCALPVQNICGGVRCLLHVGDLPKHRRCPGGYAGLGL